LLSTQVLKIGCNVGGDFAKLSHDFPDFLYTPQTKKGIIELGQLASEKNAVASGNVSLAQITAATLQQSLSKETRSSEWGARTLCPDQIHYAALDAWVTLQIYDVLQANKSVGEPLSALTPVGQPVSLNIHKQKVAYGIIVQQPTQFTLSPATENSPAVVINVSSTKTRAVIQIDKVLAPKCVIPYHHKALEEIQDGQAIFEVVVSICSLWTEGTSTPPIQTQCASELPRHPGICRLITPDNLLQSSSEAQNIRNDHLEDEEESGSEPEIDAEDTNQGLEHSGYRQDPSKNNSSAILADVFHEMFKVTKTISSRNTLLKRFAQAFTDTMLIPDQGDKAAVELVLAKKNLKWDTVKAKSPDWLWKCVRQYIPDKDVLYHILTEFFDCWDVAKCSKTGEVLFDAETWQKAKRVLHDVKKGWVSDPHNIPLYTIESQDKHGLIIYHCIRGTNSVEGSVHNPIQRKFASLNASPELADALNADFRHRHNYDVGSVHKLGKPYLGHYDPWIDHDILQLRSDIKWRSDSLIAITVSGRASQDTDPLSFQQTDEQFGITQIPGILCIQNDFSAFPIDAEEPGVYPAKLHLSKLQGNRNSMYEYLATAQQTKYAVIPVHTDDEFKLFHKSLIVGGKFASSKGSPNFDQMAAWWSTQANGKMIFYKLREHLANYYKIWSDNRKAKESMVATLSTREKNHNRLHSTGHIAHVLAAAPCNQPGILVSASDAEMDTISSSIQETVETVTSVVAPSNAQTQLLQKMLHFPEPLDTCSMFNQTGNPAPGPSALQREMFVQPMELETPVHSIPANTSISSTSIASSSARFDPGFIPWTTVQEKQKCQCVRHDLGTGNTVCFHLWVCSGMGMGLDFHT
jgi:3'-5' exonuclease